MDPNENNGLGGGNLPQPQETFNDLPIGLDSFKEFEPVHVEDFIDESFVDPPGQTGVNQVPNQNLNPNPNPNPGESPKSEEDDIIDFSKEPDPNEDQNPNPNPEQKPKEDLDLDEDAMIEKLKARGFDVKKNEETDPESEFNQLEQTLTSRISQLDQAIAMSDDQLALSKVRTNLEQKYKREGKEQLIGSPDFNEEVQDNFDELNDFNRSALADGVRANLENLKIKSENDLNLAKEKENQRINSIIQNNVRELNQGLTSIYKEGNFLGIPVTEQDMRDVLKSITSYEVSKMLSSQELVAEVGTYLHFRDKIKGLYKGATYGEGVKDVVDTLRNGQQSTSRSPLSKFIESSERNNGGNNGNNLDSHWGGNVVVPETKEEKKSYIAGSGGFM